MFEDWRNPTAPLGIDLATFQPLIDEREDAPLVAGVARPTDGADGDGANIPLAPDWTSLVRLELAPSWPGVDGCAPTQYGK